MIDRSNINVANAALDGFVINNLFIFLMKYLFSFYFCRLLNRADPQSTNKILPLRNPSEHGQAKLETTYHADFPPPYPYEMKTVAHSEYADKVNQLILNTYILIFCLSIELSKISR